MLDKIIVGLVGAGVGAGMYAAWDYYKDRQQPKDMNDTTLKSELNRNAKNYDSLYREASNRAAEARKGTSTDAQKRAEDLDKSIRDSTYVVGGAMASVLSDLQRHFSEQSKAKADAKAEPKPDAGNTK